jgi:MarR family 2-MHQ and catechol resistance regulon transcriptional repressor
MTERISTARASEEKREGGAQALKLWVVLSRAFNAVSRHAEADVAEDGLTLAEFGILEALFHKGSLRCGELQEKVLVTSGGATYLVDRLDARGLVRRVPSPTDRRVKLVELTPGGRKLIRTAFARHARRIEHALSGLSTAEQEKAARLLRTLGRVAQNLPADSTGS